MRRRPLPDLGLEPLTARSLVLSALLGSHPPRLPARALVALGSRFGIAEGTVRTALSRMVVAGELESRGSTYALGARLRRRQATQDLALRPPHEPWDGSWWIVTVDAPRRDVAQRRAFRTLMREHRMAELRPDTWLRPANVPGPPPIDGALQLRGAIEHRSPGDLVRRLWNLDAIARGARDLGALAGEACRWIETGDPDVLADTFVVSVAVVRYLRTEPQLPRAVVGADWPPDELRITYERLRRGHVALMTSFLDDVVGERV